MCIIYTLLSTHFFLQTTFSFSLLIFGVVRCKSQFGFKARLELFWWFDLKCKNFIKTLQYDLKISLFDLNVVKLW